MKNKRGLLFIITGLLLIAAALVIIVYNLWEDDQAERSVDKVMEQIKAAPPQQKYEKDDSNNSTDGTSADTSLPSDPSEEEIPDYILNPKMEMPTQNIDGYDYIGVLKIAACDIELPIISAWNYPALKVAPCRFEGSVYTDDIIIAAHAYRAHFKRIRNLVGGEEVIFTDMNGNEFRYKVVCIETVGGTDLEGLEAGDWDLSLFTCTVNKKSRFVVRCEKVSVN